MALVFYVSECGKTYSTIERKLTFFSKRNPVGASLWYSGPNTISNEELNRRSGVPTIAHHIQTNGWPCFFLQMPPNLWPIVSLRKTEADLRIHENWPLQRTWRIEVIAWTRRLEKQQTEPCSRLKHQTERR